MKNRFYKLHTECMVSKGMERSLLIDLTREVCFFIPNALAVILTKNRILDFSNLAVRNPGYEEILDEYRLFLLENEIIFSCRKEEFKLFPNLRLDWDFPALATNMIYDLNEVDLDAISNILTQCSDIGAMDVQFRFFCEVAMGDLKIFIKLLKRFSLNTVEIIFPYSEEFSNYTEVKSILKESSIIRSIVICTAPYDKVVRNKSNYFSSIQYVTQVINSHSMCGNIYPEYFVINIENFTESQHHNTCLNRKISIDINGDIKNCPSMIKSYGNIRDTKLIDVVRDPEFQKPWHIKKDEITKCKDCEFRHICTDCRAYIDNPHNQYSAPLKCGYDPYTCEWEEWSTNPLKQKAIEFYGMQELVKKETPE